MIQNRNLAKRRKTNITDVRNEELTKSTKDIQHHSWKSAGQSALGRSGRKKGRQVKFILPKKARGISKDLEKLSLCKQRPVDPHYSGMTNHSPKRG